MSDEGQTSADEGEAPAKPPVDPRLTAPQQVIPVVEFDERARLVQQVREHSERSITLLREHAEAPKPLPERGSPVLDELLWGLAQPALGLRVLLREGVLLRRAIFPALAFLLVCGLVAEVDPAEGTWGWVRAYYATMVAAAPLSPVLFTRSYAKIAADARPLLGHGEHEPYLRSHWRALEESVVQYIVVALGVAPLVAIATMLPLVGVIISVLLSAFWTLHWIVVEAFDSARTLPPGESIESMEAQHQELPPPWYAAEQTAELPGSLRWFTLPLRYWGGQVAKFARRWRGEVALIEDRPWICVGLGAGVAVLLALPIVNLLFRPAVVIAGSHALGCFEEQQG